MNRFRIRCFRSSTKTDAIANTVFIGQHHAWKYILSMPSSARIFTDYEQAHEMLIYVKQDLEDSVVYDSHKFLIEINIDDNWICYLTYKNINNLSTI